MDPNEKARLRRQSNREFIKSHKDRPCADCGGIFPVCCMDFHHVDKATKGVRVKRNGKAMTEILSGCSRARILEELDKCVVLCANCHRIRHHA